MQSCVERGKQRMGAGYAPHGQGICAGTIVPSTYYSILVMELPRKDECVPSLVPSSQLAIVALDQLVVRS